MHIHTYLKTLDTGPKYAGTVVFETTDPNIEKVYAIVILFTQDKVYNLFQLQRNHSIQEY